MRAKSHSRHSSELSRICVAACCCAVCGTSSASGTCNAFRTFSPCSCSTVGTKIACNASDTKIFHPVRIDPRRQLEASGIDRCKPASAADEADDRYQHSCQSKGSYVSARARVFRFAAYCDRRYSAFLSAAHGRFVSTETACLSYDAGFALSLNPTSSWWRQLSCNRHA